MVIKNCKSYHAPITNNTALHSYAKRYLWYFAVRLIYFSFCFRLCSFAVFVALFKFFIAGIVCYFEQLRRIKIVITAIICDYIPSIFN